MRVAILHNAVADTDQASDRDVLVQLASVEGALKELGHTTRRIGCTLNLEKVEEALSNERPDVVFNLVESLAGSDRLAHLAAVLLDDLELPYTGTPAAALHVTNNKLLAKERMRLANLPTADWFAPCTSTGQIACNALTPPYIIKAIWEHASVGIDDHAVIATGDGSTIREQIESRTRQIGHVCFAERYVAGREFNLSLIAGGESPRVLPPAEIDFSAFPADKPRIVGYAAKWDEKAFEYGGTPRTFQFAKSDAPLLDWLRTLAVQTWQLFDLRGYARVDFRVDPQGQPWILEVNANPCLSPDAGFAAALEQASIPLEHAIAWILDDALHTRPAAEQEMPRLSVPGSRAAAPRTAKTASSPSSKRKRTAATKLRCDVTPSDAETVRQLVESTGLFRPGEVSVAVELVEARLAKGPDSGYEFAFAMQRGVPVGYACFGRNSLTVSSFDLYWIAVDKARQGQGIGRLLLDEVERQVRAAGGTRIYIETSHRADYQATRGFYERCGYQLQTVLDDYYAPGDGRAIYLKTLA